MREISLYKMQPQYEMGDVKNILLLKEKNEKDEILFFQIEQDFKRNPVEFKEEFLKAKKNYLSNKYFYYWFCLKRYFEQAIVSDCFKDQNSQKNKLKESGWMLPHQFINISLSTNDYNVTIEELYIRNFDRMFDKLFSFVIDEQNARINDYYNQAIFNYKNHCYYSCVVSLFPIIESYHKNMTDFNEDAFYKIKEHLEKVVNKVEKVKKIYKKEIDYYVNIVKQFNTLAKQYFAISLEKDNEPEIINRNRIMHGLFTREIDKKDCLQLFCVISNLRVIKDIINLNDNLTETLKELEMLK